MTEKYKIGGMTCAACQSHVRNRTGKLPGISGVQVNLLTGIMELERDPNLAAPGDVIRAVTEAGYSAELISGKDRPDAEERKTRFGNDGEDSAAAVRLLLSTVFFLPLLWLSMGGMLHLPRPSFLTGETGAMLNALLQLYLFLPILFWNLGYFRRGVRALLHGGANMDTLVALGAGAGTVSSLFLMGQMARLTGCGETAQAQKLLMNLTFEGPAMILILVSFGKLLESKAKRRTGEAIEKLMNLTPPRASVLRDNKEIEIDVRDLVPGDRAVLRTGSAIPADGILEEGVLSLDQSALTGESLPVERMPGSMLSAGTTVLNGYGRMKVEKTGSDTTLAKVAALVEAAAASRAPSARIADKASAIFVPVVLCCALSAFLGWMIWGPTFHEALSAAMAVLLISCPCALGLATPVAVMAGTGRGAELGILFRNAETLETLHRIRTILLDKTGTVTANSPAVTRIFPADGVTEAELLSAAADLEAASQHPLAEAVLACARKEGIKPGPVTQMEVVPGEGIRARRGDSVLSGGNLRMMRNLLGDPAWDTPVRAGHEALGETVVFFAEGDRYLGGMTFADPVTGEAIEAVSELRKLGLTPVLLTGDSPGAADAAGKRLGIEDVRGGLLPADKERIVREFQAAGATAMAGDGINDAPALARADAGIAVARGTDIALASADVVLMNSDLRTLPSAFALSRAVIRTIHVNLFWAFFYNVIGIPVAAGLFYPWFGPRLPPEFGAAAMSLSSVCVVLNALRLRRFSSSANLKSKHKESSPMNERIMSVDGMACAHCAGRVEQALSQISGVRSASVNLAEKSVTIQADDSVSDDVLTGAVRNAGYTPISISRK